LKVRLNPQKFSDSTTVKKKRLSCFHRVFHLEGTTQNISEDATALLQPSCRVYLIWYLVVIPSVYRIFSASVRNTRNSSIIKCVWCQMRTAFLTPTVYEIQLWKRNEITRSASHCWCCWNEKQILHWAKMITQFLHGFYIKCCYSWCQTWSAIVFFLVLAIPIIFRNWQTTAHRLNVCTEHSPKRKITYWARKRKTNWIMKMNAQ